MATTIQLEIQVNAASATADIQKVDAAAKAVGKQPVTINFQSKGAGIVINEAKSVQTAYNEAIAAIARLGRAEQDQTISANNRAKAEANASAAIERRIGKEVDAASRREQAQARESLQAQRHADRMEEIAARTGEATTASNAFSVALGNMASRAASFVWRKIVQGIRDAVQEMKNVDTQLTNISKVSGKTGQ